MHLPRAIKTDKTLRTLFQCFNGFELSVTLMGVGKSSPISQTTVGAVEAQTLKHREKVMQQSSKKGSEEGVSASPSGVSYCASRSRSVFGLRCGWWSSCLPATARGRCRRRRQSLRLSDGWGGSRILFALSLSVALLLACVVL